MKSKKNIITITIIVFVILAMIAGMIALIVTGNGGFAPLVIPAGMLPMIITVLINWFYQPKESSSDVPVDEKEREEAAIKKVQETKGRPVSNKFAIAQYEIDNINRLKTTVTKSAKIATIIILSLIVAFLITVVVGIVLLIKYTIFVVVIIGFCGFVLTIASSLIGTSILRKLAMKKLSPEYIALHKTVGEVVGCASESTSMVGTDLNGKQITNVTYRVKVVSNNKDYIGFSHTFYNIGAKVEFVPRKYGFCKIIDNTNDENQVETVE